MYAHPVLRRTRRQERVLAGNTAGDSDSDARTRAAHSNKKIAVTAATIQYCQSIDLFLLPPSLVLFILAEPDERLRQFPQASIHPVVNGPLFNRAILLPHAGRDPGQGFDPLVYGTDRPDMEPAFADRLTDARVQQKTFRRFRHWKDFVRSGGLISAIAQVTDGH